MSELQARSERLLNFYKAMNESGFDLVLGDEDMVDNLLTPEQLDKIKQNTAIAKDDPEWSYLVPDVNRLLKHIETQQHMIIAAVSSLKPFMDNNPSDEQVMKYLQDYAYLIANVPTEGQSELVDDPNLWQLPKFED